MPPPTGTFSLSKAAGLHDRVRIYWQLADGQSRRCYDRENIQSSQPKLRKLKMGLVMGHSHQ